MLSTVYLYLWVPVNFQNVFIVCACIQKISHVGRKSGFVFLFLDRTKSDSHMR